MIIHVPDPHPGRCLNYRRDPSDSYGLRNLRCLKREGHTEACRFPSPPPQISTDWSTYVQAEAEEWVDPS